MMGKPNTLEEQEEQKKREAESFFAQKDSGTNREQSEVTPPTPPKKPGFWDWLAGVFGYAPHLRICRGVELCKQ